MINRADTINSLVAELNRVRAMRDAADINTADGMWEYYRLRGACIGIELAITEVQKMQVYK